MARNQMLCEPNTNLPQKFVLESLRQIKKSDNEVQEVDVKSAAVNQVLYEMKTGYKVLPLLHEPDEEIRNILSLDSNEYLRLRWQAFLEKLPEYYVKIKLYKDFVAREDLSRNKSLNGQFYGIDNKLAPIPFMPDPRQNNAKVPQSCLKQCTRLKKPTVETNEMNSDKKSVK